MAFSLRKFLLFRGHHPLGFFYHGGMKSHTPSGLSLIVVRLFQGEEQAQGHDHTHK